MANSLPTGALPPPLHLASDELTSPRALPSLPGVPVRRHFDFVAVVRCFSFILTIGHGASDALPRRSAQYRLRPCSLDHD